MKKVYILIPVVVLVGILLVLTLPKNKNGMSVRENIVQTDTSYSWEQWCHYDTLAGVKKVHVADFELKASVKNVGNLNTDVCN